MEAHSNKVEKAIQMCKLGHLLIWAQCKEDVFTVELDEEEGQVEYGDQDPSEL